MLRNSKLAHILVIVLLLSTVPLAASLSHSHMFSKPLDHSRLNFIGDFKVATVSPKTPRQDKHALNNVFFILNVIHISMYQKYLFKDINLFKDIKNKMHCLVKF